MNDKIETIKSEYKLYNRNNNKIEIEKYYMDMFQKRRREIISMFSKLPQIQLIKNELNSEQIYKAVFEVIPRDELSILKDKKGKILPSLVDNNGKIRHQARLEPMSNQSYDIFNNIILQNKLEIISEQLFIIDKKVKMILKGQHNDRISIIEGAQDTIQQAILVKDQRIKENLLTNSITELNKGKRQLINETLEYIDEFKNISKSEIIKIIDGLLGNLNYDKMNNQATIVQKNMQIILEATYYQVMAYDILGEDLDIDDITESIKKVDTHNLYVEKEIDKWLGGENLFTFKTFNNIAEILKDYKKMENINLVELELTGKEIMEGGNLN